MAIKSATYQFKGMNRDLSNINASNQFAYEIRNMKITANEDNTLLSISTNKGTKYTNIQLQGTPIGHATIDNQWVIFCAGDNFQFETPEIEVRDFNIQDIRLQEGNIDEITPKTYDYIYKITKLNDTYFHKYVCGVLNFDKTKPIETITFTENEDLKKVYWTDGKNQLRFIRLDRINDDFITSSEVDFIPEVKNSNEQVTISKEDSTIGMFPAGTTQYAFSYINYYGQQSNLFYISSIYYNVSTDKALEVNKTSSNSYKINIEGLNHEDYQYVRIYSIVRTSQDSIPEVRVVTDYKLENNFLEYTDRHTTGYTIDPTDLFYIGGEQLVIGTMTQKDNTLFIGDITQKKEVLPENIVNKIFGNYSDSIEFDLSKATNPKDYDKCFKEEAGDKYYEKQFQLDNPSKRITTFKGGDYYRFGVQFQHKSGRWSEPLWLGDKQNDYYPKTYKSSSDHTHVLSYAKFDLSNIQSELEELKQLGYIKVRPVIVYPELEDRVTLCQGYLCPTVYNAGERLNKNGIYAQSSWFARPYTGLIDYDPNSTYQSEAEDQHGAFLEFRHNAYIGGKYTRHQEIQGADRFSYYSGNKDGSLNHTNDSFSFLVKDGTNITEWKNEHSHQFFVDCSIVTMHSPEFEFDDKLQSLNLDAYKFRIVGFVPLTSHQGDIDVITSKGTRGEQDNSWLGSSGYNVVGFYKSIKSKANYSKYGGHLLCSGVFYRDFYTYSNTNVIQVPRYTDYTLTEFYDQNKPYADFSRSGNGPMGYHIFPFHCSGNITNNPEDDDNYNTLQYKKLSNVRYSYGNKYIPYQDNNDLKDIETTSIKLFYQDQNQLLRINNHNNEQVFYSGNIDTVIVSKYLDNGTIKTGSFRRESPQVGFFMLPNAQDITIRSLNLTQVNALPYVLANEGSIQTDPIIMRYKSTPHAVISLKGDDITQNILPTVNGKNKYAIGFYEGSKPFWQTENGQFIKVQDPLHNFEELSNYTGLWLAEIYQDINTDVIFGGNTKQAIANNKWTIAGEEVVLSEYKTLYYTEGDTYYQRYDNMKTYPWSMEEVNGITDVISFMVETRINLEGRYDSNKADKPHFHILPSNFNLINKAYTQKNNFFSYYGVDYDRIEVNKYPNLIFWSKTKTKGETVDTWLNLNLSSTLDLDGNNGKITSLQNYNGSILAFQENAINQILYNEQTQFSTTAGVPIEIANSGKVTGYRNISNQIGCSNKWSICQTPNGLYFLDSFNKDLYKYGEGLNNLSNTNGFNSYLRNIQDIEKPWNPLTLDSIKTSYDPINKEVLFSTKNETLSYSEQLQSFMSFYDFKVNYFTTLQGNSLILGDSKVYEYQKGPHNYYFDSILPYSIEFISNPDPLLDKSFNTIEFRSDSWYSNNLNTNGTLADFETFDKIYATNEYQKAEEVLEYNKYGLSNLKKKFRIWKAFIPRDRNTLRDRIRNTWTRVKLERIPKYSNNCKTVLHDITIYYNV